MHLNLVIIWYVKLGVTYEMHAKIKEQRSWKLVLRHPNTLKSEKKRNKK